MKKEMVGEVPGNVLGMLADLMHKFRHDSEMPRKLGKLLKGELFESGRYWLQEILNREYQRHLDFFGCNFDLSEFEKTLKKYGQKTINKWQKLGLEPHFLPEVVLSQDNNLSGWEIKPEDWYYQKAAEGKILRNINGELKADKKPFNLEGITVLIDTRLKPAYNNGKQMYENDNLLGPIIKQLRRDGKITKYEYGLQSSRFGVSADEWENQIKPLLSERIGPGVRQVRLERTIEANVIPQLYPYMSRKDDGNTNTWVWYEEYFEDRDYRLNGGHSDIGGLAHVRYALWPDRHWYYRSVRPLAVLNL